MRKRDQKLAQELDSLAKQLEQNGDIESNEVRRFANKPQFRPMLYPLLKRFNRADLFPDEFLTEDAQGAAKLAYWMMHPNELRDAPREIELAEKVSRIIEGQESSFFVYRYRMRQGHWAGDGWMLGLAGPFVVGDAPYMNEAGAFSRCNDSDGTIAPTELVDWFVTKVTRKTSG